MMQDCTVLSKGSFSTFRFNEFVSVKQYLLVREGGKKYLLLRLANEAKAQVTGLKLRVEQIDIAGEVISTDHITVNNVNGKAGKTFVLGDKIPLKEACIEVTINLIGASYGEYEYAVKSNELVIKYVEKQKKEGKDYSKLIDGKNTVVTKDRFFAVPKILPFIAVILIAVSVVLAYFNMGKVITESDRFLWSDVYYEFVDPDRDPEAGVIAVSNAGITGNIHIPEQIEGYKVVGIANGAFERSDTIYNVTIDAPIDVPKEAFAQCANLCSVTLNGPKVIGEGAFNFCYNLTTFNARNLEHIGARAFFSCSKLQNINVTADKGVVLSIGQLAFNSCNFLENVVVDQYIENVDGVAYFSNGENLKKLHLENLSNRTIASLFNTHSNFPKLETLIIDDMESIPADFAYACNSLKKVNIKGVTNTILSDRAFYNCSSLDELNVLDADGQAVKFTQIGNAALQGTKIVQFDLSMATVIGEYAFANNSKLFNLNTSADCPIERIGEGAFSDCTHLLTFNLSNVTLEIGDNAFARCSNLKTFAISELSVLQKIGNGAFENCYNLQQFNGPHYLKVIGDRAFINCTSLANFNFSVELENIGDHAFQGCVGFNNVTLHENVKTIGLGAFADCSNIEEMTITFVGYSLTEKNYLASMFNTYGFNESSSVPTSLKSVTVLKGDVGANAFNNLSQIKEINLSSDTTVIGANAFIGCENLRAIEVPTDVVSIGADAFTNCYRLFEVRNTSSLPIELGSNSYGNIAQYALIVYDADDDQMEKVISNGFEIANATNGWFITDYVGTSRDWVTPASFASLDGSIIREYNIPAHLFQYSDVQTLAVSAAVKSIGEYAFESCPNLAKVSIAKNCQIEEIEQFTFNDCYNLKTIELNDGLKKISNNAFASSAITNITLPQSLEQIGEYVFMYAPLTQLTIPENVVSIGYASLCACDQLKSLTTPFVGNTMDYNTNLAYMFGYNYSYTLEQVNVTKPQNVGDYAFNGFEGLRKVTLVEGVKSIGLSSFENCYELTEFVMPKTVQSIGAYAFVNCNKLDVSLPSSLKEVGEYAFASTAITSIKFSKNLTYLGESAFSNCLQLTTADFSACKNLTSIPANCFISSNLSQVGLYGSAVKDIGNGSFENCRRLSKLKLGLSTENIGDRAFYYCLMLDEVTFPQNVAVIGYEAFAYSNVSSLLLKANVNIISDRAFYSCNALTSVEISTNALERIGSYVFGRCAKLISATLEIDNVDYMGAYMFAECDDLEEVTIVADDIKELIGTFYSCTALEKFNLQMPNLNKIGDYAYYNCQAITNFTVPETITTIGYNAFENCSNLEWIKLSHGLTSIKSEAFNGCNKLYEVFNPTSLNIQRGFTTYGSIALNAVVVHDSLSDAFIQTETIIINDIENTNLSGEFTFKYAPDVCCLFEYSGNIENLKLTSVILGGKTYNEYYVRQGVFSDDFNLKTLDTGVVTEICASAFYNCKNLIEVTINSNIKANKVHSNAFSQCVKLWEVHDKNANYNIVAGSNECGNVAKYAIAINEHITYIEIDSNKLLKVNDVWYLYDSAQANSGKVVLPSVFKNDDYTIENYVLFAHPQMHTTGVFAGLSGYFNDYVVIPKSVIGIMDWAFNPHDMPIIYYEGSQENWQASSFEATYLSPYFYAKCIHYEFGDSNIWTYDERGNPTTKQTEFDDKGECATCDRRIIATNTLGELVAVDNQNKSFKIDQEDRVYFNNDSSYGKFDAQITITAQKDLKISFKLIGQGGSEEILVITQNEETKEAFDSNYNKTLEFELKAGDVLAISLTRNAYYGKTCSISIEQIEIVEIIEDTENETEDGREGE